MEEIWRDIKGWEGVYAISNFGRVYSYRNDLYLAQIPNQDGYLRVRLSNNGFRKMEFIHRLVALHFIDNPDKKPQVNHKDENRQNNRVDNLEWVTAKENNNYGNHNAKVAKAHSKPVKCIETGEIFPSGKAAGEKYGIPSTWINAVCRGVGKTAGGYHWERI